MTFLGEPLTRRDIIEALEWFASQYPDTNDYDSWLCKGTYRYAVRHNKKLYPPKLILSTARGCARSEFRGGGRTNRVFRALGFEVIDKPRV